MVFEGLTPGSRVVRTRDATAGDRGRPARLSAGLHHDAKARSLAVMAARRLRRAGRPAATV